MALYFEKPNSPPKFIYVFENGRIRAIVSPTFVRRGAGHVRTKSRVTLFSSNGDPEYQIDIGPDPKSQVPADASHAAASFDIQESDVPEACTSLWFSYIAKSAVLAAAIATFKSALASCVTIITCPLAGPTGIAVVVATDAWQAALDKLLDCMIAEQEREAAEQQAPPPGSGGGNPDDGSVTGPNSEWEDSTTSTVNDFINSAIASGNYSCSSDGTRCVYYAA